MRQPKQAGFIRADLAAQCHCGAAMRTTFDDPTSTTHVSSGPVMCRRGHWWEWSVELRNVHDPDSEKE
jgi:hypothetical protein